MWISCHLCNMTTLQNNTSSYEFEFEQVFVHPQTRPLFLQQVKHELNEENTNFVASAQQFKQAGATRELGLAIYEEYIKKGAKQEINLSATTKSQIDMLMNQSEWNGQVFDTACAQVMLNLKIEVFARFQRSKLWQEFVNKADAKLLKQGKKRMQL